MAEIEKLQKEQKSIEEKLNGYEDRLKASNEQMQELQTNQAKEESIKDSSKASILSTAAKGVSLFTVASNEKVVVDMSVTRYDLEKLEVGQSANITLAGKNYEGTVSRLSRLAAENAKGTPVVSAEIQIENPDDSIYLGLEAKVKVEGHKAENVLIVPVEAVNTGKDGSFCYVVENGVVVKREVETALSSASLIEVKSGLKAGDQVIKIGTDDVTGLSVEMTIFETTKEVTIIGVFKEKQSEGGLVDSMMYNGNRVTLYMPYTSNYAFGYILDEFYGIYVIAENGYSSRAVSNEIVRLLEQRYQVQGEDQFYVEDAESQISMITDVLDMLTAFIALVAAIALLVGGIGVMNIMLVSVTERTREIGIRKALGARTGSIMLQFLSESAIITCIGGIIGIILGVLGARAVCSLPMLGFEPRISVATIVLATLFSSCVGIIFGVYPAKKAAKLSPIEALRRN